MKYPSPDEPNITHMLHNIDVSRHLTLAVHTAPKSLPPAVRCLVSTRWPLKTATGAPQISSGWRSFVGTEKGFVEVWGFSEWVSVWRVPFFGRPKDVVRTPIGKKRPRWGSACRAPNLSLPGETRTKKRRDMKGKQWK